MTKAQIVFLVILLWLVVSFLIQAALEYWEERKARKNSYPKERL